jgi:hypothetical protein
MRAKSTSYTRRVGFFRRRDETYNEQMLREAGLTADGEPIEQAEVEAEPERKPAPDPVQTVDRLIRSDARFPLPPGWDAAASADGSTLTRNEYSFATLPDGSLIVDDDCDEDLSRLADAIEKEIGPPYEARASRRADGGWSVVANAIEVVDLPHERADNLEVACYAGEVTFKRDGETVDSNDAPQALIELGQDCGDDYVVEATRLDGTAFDATARPL